MGADITAEAKSQAADLDTATTTATTTANADADADADGSDDSQNDVSGDVMSAVAALHALASERPNDPRVLKLVLQQRVREGVPSMIVTAADNLTAALDEGKLAKFVGTRQLSATLTDCEDLDALTLTDQERKNAKVTRKSENEETARLKKDLAMLKMALKTKCVAQAVTREGEPALFEGNKGLVLPTPAAFKSAQSGLGLGTANRSDFTAAFVSAFRDLAAWEVGGPGLCHALNQRPPTTQLLQPPPQDVTKRPFIGLSTHLERLRSRPAVALAKVDAIMGADKAPDSGLCDLRLVCLFDLGWVDLSDHERRLLLRKFPPVPRLQVF